MSIFYRFIRALVRGYFSLFHRLKIYGIENLKSDAGAIIAANHASFFDPPIVAVSSPDEVHFLARESLFKNPIFGKLISSLNAHPLGGDAGDIAIFRAIGKLLTAGRKVILFPEGTRTHDGKMGLIKPGIGLLTMKYKAAIIPTYVDGSYEVYSRHRKLPKLFGRVNCVFGTPIHWEDFSNMDRKQAQVAIVDELGQRYRRLKEWFESGAKGSPP